MKKCPECGHRMDDLDYKEEDLGFTPEMEGEEDEELALKDGVLAELEELLEGTLSSKLSSKKPAAVSIEMISAKPKKDEEEEE